MIDPSALSPGWREPVAEFFASETGRGLSAFLDERRRSGAHVYPPEPLRALTLTPFAEVRVVILGQDPYHAPGQAHGLAFSVPRGVRAPPSLRNIFAELARDLGCTPPDSGSLERWARQGVLLLNALLTVEEGRPGAHAGRGWEQLTAELLRRLAEDQRPKVFMLWGAHAQARRANLGAPHLVLESNHPSPLSARRPPVPFLGCCHFSRANTFLQQLGRGSIDWCSITPGQAMPAAAAEPSDPPSDRA